MKNSWKSFQSFSYFYSHITNFQSTITKHHPPLPHIPFSTRSNPIKQINNECFPNNCLVVAARVHSFYIEYIRLASSGLSPCFFSAAKAVERVKKSSLRRKIYFGAYKKARARVERLMDKCSRLVSFNFGEFSFPFGTLQVANDRRLKVFVVGSWKRFSSFLTTWNSFLTAGFLCFIHRWYVFGFRPSLEAISLLFVTQVFIVLSFQVNKETKVNRKKAINRRKKDEKLTWILEECGWRSILCHRDTLMILVHDIRQRNRCRACEKHVMTQIWRAS